MKLAPWMLIGFALVAPVRAARAEDPRGALCPIASCPNPACPAATAAGGEQAGHSDVWLTRLPLVGRFFTTGSACAGGTCVTGSCANGSCAGAAGGAAAREQIGFDFDFELCPPPPAFAQVLGFAGLSCPCDNCVCCPCAGQCAGRALHRVTFAAGRCDNEHCQVAACPDASCGCQDCPARETAQHFDHVTPWPHPACGLTKLFEKFAALSAEKAAAEAALAAREEADEQLGELLESMVELATENAALEAKLAAHGEQVKLAEKLVELATENAKLKAQVELADARHDLLRESMQVAVENERLKVRVAELEKQQATATAVRPRANKPR